ncbi:MAG: hypothetical protein NTW53_18580 [Burkholderiales bacterium]|nr:hypothetical protein [Burkholderiales bacterium]
MISIEQRRRDQLYQYRGGMLNAAWVAGTARGITQRGGFIQQSNNLNQMIGFVMEQGDSMPGSIREGDNLKVIGRIHSSREGAEPIVVLKVLALETPSIMDMPPREAWERALRQGTPSDSVRPQPIANSIDHLESDDDANSMGKVRVADVGNMVEFAGFVASVFLEPAGVLKPDGTVTKGCLVMLMRQTKDKDDLVPIRFYGAKAEPFARRIQIGQPLKIEARLRVRLKNTGEPADANGILPVHKYLYVHATNICVANRRDITEEPAWAKEMFLQEQSKRAQRKQAAQYRANASAQGASSQASTPASAAPAPAGHATAPADLADAIDMSGIDSSMLASITSGGAARRV